MLGTAQTPGEYPPAGMGGHSFDHLIGAGNLMNDDTPLPFSRPAAARVKPNAGSRVRSQFLGDRCFGCCRVHAQGASGKPWPRMVDRDDTRDPASHWGSETEPDVAEAGLLIWINAVHDILNTIRYGFNRA
jgi:hypothetical protein